MNVNLRATYAVMPDPKDQTPNQPALILEPKDIEEIGYKADICPPGTSTDKRAIAYRDYVVKKAKEAGWGEITLAGKQIILIAKLELQTPGKPADA